MPAQMLDGAPVAARLREALAPEVDRLKARGAGARIVALSIADSPASRAYAREQRRAFESFGVAFEEREIGPGTSPDTLLGWIDGLNADRAVTGVTLHLPLPAPHDARRALLALDPAKDIEGIHPANIGMLALGPHEPASCSARAGIELLRSLRPSLRGLEVAILGKGEVVGKPLLLMLLEHKKDAATPSVLSTGTRDLAAHTRAADVIFCAAGRPGLLRGDMVKPGAIVIDIGINEVPDLGPDGKPVLTAKGRPKQKLVGDAVLEEVAQVASHVTPVPGGVGPVATVLLVRNWVACCKRQTQEA
jgi:methylenetetrahydrofolate dehydrogenase (NADP+)/methenyltetrahydrofolate cyclohydrolase